MDMRTGSNARRRVVLANVGKEEQHQQGPSLRGHVDAPVQEVVLIAGFGWKAGVNVPARVSRIVRGGKSNGKRPQIHAGTPTRRTNKLIERFVQDGCVRCLRERLLS